MTKAGTDRPFSYLATSAFLLLSASPVWGQSHQPELFTKSIAPILSGRCIQCHGQGTPMSDLDLRSREGMLKGGKHGAAVVPGNADSSSLYRHLAGSIQPQMPLGGRLTTQEIALFKSWIDQGAAWDGTAAGALLTSSVPAEKKFTAAQRKYWAFQPVNKPTVPATAEQTWGRNPIDAFVLAKLENKKIRPNAPADKVTLLRRATLDLTGLPPTTEEVQAFLSDDSPDAFAKVVDHLLASPEYGERWGRYWLDLARYADTNGFKADEVRPNIWRYRDYVIQSFNDDKPYDRFVREQIAGDELYPDDNAARIAVGFNRHYTDETNQPVLELRRQEMLNDVTDTVASVFMGMTYGCAKCHDHKFDPILHKDYYRLQAFFSNMKADDKLNLLKGDKLEAYNQELAAWDAKTRDIRRQMHAIVEPIGKAKSDYYSIRFSTGTKEALNTPAKDRTPLQSLLAIYATPQITYKDDDLAKELKGDEKKRYSELAAQLKSFDSIKPAVPLAQTVIDNGRAAPKTFVLAGGSWDAPKEEVQPGFLSILDPTDPKIVPPEGMNSTGRRSVLANWLADPKNPLTTRVIVNRIWHGHFGTGIVPSTSDFGLMGERPANLALLDFLTATFVENGWSIKKLHRTIMLSNVYQESSAAQDQALGVDPDDKLMWRYPRHRVEGEVVRDSMLLTSGLLNPKMGGPGIHPELPDGTLAPGTNWTAEKDPTEENRRSVYIFSKRVMTYPMFEAFDAPNSEESCPRRFRTVIPSQALTLMNDKLVLSWSQTFAQRILNDRGLTPEQQVQRAFRMALSRPPNPQEEEASLKFLNQQSSLLAGRLAHSEKIALPATISPDTTPAQVAAFVDFCHALLNSNEFMYVN
jgi:Protein of unknown function (DUF1553)/Protein of unknown function (DUF1549)/Planctomycete cytochrome C